MKQINELMPDFDDPQLQHAILEQMIAYAKAMGFKDEELKDIRDRKVLTMVFKAMKFDELMHLVETGKISKE